jgi:hypothetical protein
VRILPADKVPQGSGAWFQARCGVLTASNFDEICTPEFTARTGDKPRNFLCRKVAEMKLNYSQEMMDPSAGTHAMEQGQLLERIALPWFNFEYNADVKQVGFCISDDGRTGCSPDGMAEGYGLEIKSPLAHTHVRYLLDGGVPKDYRPQVHFSMWITGLPVWYFISFNRSLPKLVVKVERDEEIQAKITNIVTAYHLQLDAALEHLRNVQNGQAQPPQ